MSGPSDSKTVTILDYEDLNNPPKQYLILLTRANVLVDIRDTVGKEPVRCFCGTPEVSCAMDMMFDRVIDGGSCKIRFSAPQNPLLNPNNNNLLNQVPAIEWFAKSLFENCGIKLHPKLKEPLIAMFSSQLTSIYNTTDVSLIRGLYNRLIKVPYSTATLADLKEQHGLLLNGPFGTSNPGRAVLIIAFKEGVPMVVKIPNDHNDAVKEYSNWLQLSDAISDLKTCHLLPSMECIHLGQITVANEGRVMERVDQTGLVLPMYACSWAAVPKAAPSNIILKYAKQCEAGLRAIHSVRCAHNDIKPGNCFIDFTGSLDIGDYGALLPFGADFVEYTHEYFPAGYEGKVCAATDMHMLAVSVLEMSGLIWQTTTRHPFTKQAVLNLSAVAPPEINAYIQMLLL